MDLAMFHAILDAIPQPVFVKDNQHRWIFVNNRYCELMQRDRSALIGKTDFDIYPAAQAQQFYREDDRVLSEGEALLVETHITLPNGKPCWLLKCKARIETSNGRYVIGVSTDITTQKQAELAAQLNEIRLSAIANGVPGLVLYIDADRRYRFVNQTFEQWYGVSASDACGRRIEEILTEEEFELAKPYIERALAGERVVFDSAVVGHSQRWARTELVPDISVAGQVIGYYALASDITESKRLEESLRQANLALKDMALRDALTGLYNRRYLEESLNQQLMKAKRDDTHVGILVFDIDHFKRYNDSLGHAAGDAILIAISTCLQGEVRASDILCRYGGEEFVLAQADVAEDQFRRRAEELRAKVQALSISYNGAAVGTVTVSIGLAMFPDHGCTGADIIAAADTALYQAKRAGRNRVVVYVPPGGNPA
jgi:diguanylate cyclase (GGDEF)-like protein/PAS domain S-box-containing protein